MKYTQKSSYLTKMFSFIWCAVCSLHECPKLLQNCNRKWICVLLELVIQSRSGTTKLDIFDILMKTWLSGSKISVGRFGNNNITFLTWSEKSNSLLVSSRKMLVVSFYTKKKSRDQYNFTWNIFGILKSSIKNCGPFRIKLSVHLNRKCFW